MNLKKIVAAGIAAVCAVSMAACGGSGSGSSKVTDIQYKDIKLGQTGKDIKANLKLFSHRTDMLKNDYPGTTWKQYIAEFNKTYPNIKVTVEANSDYANSAMTRLQGGDWGDIMMIPAVDRAELQNYFISYGSLGDMNKEIKYAVNQSYQKKVYGVASGRQRLRHRLQQEDLQGGRHRQAADHPEGIHLRPEGHQGEDQGHSAVHQLRGWLDHGRLGRVHRRHGHRRSQLHEQRLHPHQEPVQGSG